MSELAKVISFEDFKNRKNLLNAQASVAKKTPVIPRVYNAGQTDNAKYNAEISERIERIKNSIVRINTLMSELRDTPEAK